MTPRRPLLRPLVPAYAAALAVKEILRARKLLPVRHLPDAVISVGSLSAGGAGKTPLVLALAKALSKRDYAVRILTRGYGRQGRATERVDPAGDPARFGDEPLLLAQRSGVPVFVGADRYRAALLARQLPSTQRIVYLLDDGFQHRRLARDLDLVLLTAQDLGDFLLPVGNLREPLSRLKQADVIVVREEERDQLAPLLQQHAPQPARPDEEQPAVPATWILRRQLDFPGAVSLPQRPLVFCGIARPDGLQAMLASKNMLPVTTITFPDHHRYSPADIERVCAEARQLGADGVVTTEKDAVKLTAEQRTRIESVAPLLVGRLDVEIVQERAAVEQIIRQVSRMNRRRRPVRP